MSKCCNTCPILKDNVGRPMPKFANKFKSDTDWFSKENIESLMEGLGEGTPLKCHSRDEQGSKYGSVDAKETKVCIGAVYMAYIEVKAFEDELEKEEPPNANLAYKRYKSSRKRPMTLKGLSDWAMMIALGRTSLIGGLSIPREMSETRELLTLNSEL